MSIHSHIAADHKNELNVHFVT